MRELRIVASFVRRLLREQPLRFLAVTGTLGLAGLVEGLGIATIVPLLEIATAGGASDTPQGRLATAVSHFLAFFGLPFNLTTVVVLVGLLLVGQQLLVAYQQKLAFGTAYRFEAELRGRLYRHLFDAEWLFFVRQKAATLANALTVEARRGVQAYRAVSTLLGTAVVVVVYFALALALSWQMTLMIMAAGLFILYFVRGRISAALDIGRAVTDINAALQGEVMEHISGAKLIKGTAVEDAATREFEDSTHNLAHQQYRSGMNEVVVKAFYDIVTLVVILLGIHLAVSRFQMSIAGLVVFLVVFYRLSPKLPQMQVNLQLVLTYVPAVQAIDELDRLALQARERQGGESVTRFQNEVAFRDVDFAYVPGRPVLDGLDLRIPRGRTVAVVGTSGSGKTTVVDILMGLLEPQGGEVLVDGVPMSRLDLRRWRSRIGYVAQDAVFFHASVRENVLFTKPDASEGELREALRFAYAEGFVDALAEGPDTIIGDRGVALSGGQRQRLALARAVLRSPEILILDEATSALDAQSEERIQEAISRLAGKTTLVIVTHRLATVRSADIINVLEDGRITERGSWDELVGKNGRFQALRALQELT